MGPGPIKLFAPGAPIKSRLGLVHIGRDFRPKPKNLFRGHRTQPAVTAQTAGKHPSPIRFNPQDGKKFLQQIFPNGRRKGQDLRPLKGQGITGPLDHPVPAGPDFSVPVKSRTSIPRTRSHWTRKARCGAIQKGPAKDRSRAMSKILHSGRGGQSNFQNAASAPFPRFHLPTLFEKEPDSPPDWKNRKR